jgi:hypothetical protein
MRIVCAILLLGSCIGLQAQKGTGYFRVNRIISRIPDSLTISTDRIAGYIDANFTKQEEKSRAVFIWITGNIRYCFDSIFTISRYPDPEEISEKILKTKTGVCLHYANLFYVLSNKVGIKTYVIQGYTKQHGRVDYLPHLWCASFIDSAWYLFDPTWGSGYTAGRRFIRQVNYYYYMTRPEDLIRSHMPFDPLWQFLNHTVSSREFYEGNYVTDRKKPFFNYHDTLRAYENAGIADQYIASARRIEANGVTNSFIEAKLRVLRGEIEYLRNKTNAEQYDTAVSYYNEGIRKLNRFIGYRNKQFKPVMDSTEIMQMIDSTAYLFNATTRKLGEIKEPDVNAVGPVIELGNAVAASLKVLNEQRLAAIKYIQNRKCEPGSFK